MDKGVNDDGVEEYDEGALATSHIRAVQGADFGTRYTQDFAVDVAHALPFLSNEAKYRLLEEGTAVGDTMDAMDTVDAAEAEAEATVTYARNEDVCRVWAMPSIVEGLNGDMLVAVVADGHASVELPDGNAVGGYEIAENTVEVVARSLTSMAARGDGTGKKKGKVAFDKLPQLFMEIFYTAHEEATRACLSQEDDFIHGSFGPLNKRRVLALQNPVPALPQAATGKGVADRANQQRVGLTTRIPVCTVPCAAEDYDSEDKMADYGCTLTVVLVLPADPSSGRRVVVTANVGDSEAHLYRDNVHAEALTTVHTVANEAERTRMRRYGVKVVPSSPYFHVSELQRSLMISRCIGHAVMQHFGFLYHPHVSTYTVEAGDVLVLATDGVWDFIDPRIIAPDHFDSVDGLSARFAAILRPFPQRDNAAWCILKFV